MDRDRWSQVDKLFQDALLVEPDKRLEVLSQWCLGDDALFEEIRAMLFYHENHPSFIENSVKDQVIELIGHSEERKVPSIIGGYIVEKLIAHGGMGSVYIAKQTEPVERTVAIKVINSREKDFLQRFDYERQVLAALKHPHVAQVYDAGITQDGYHYFTMEYVEGKDLLSYCDSVLLDIESRLKLFRLVCEGVAHAHRRGVIHRDLKPSNILVNFDEEKPIPKIIDFGIAQKISESTATVFSNRVFGTKAYMSPECFKEGQADTTADIYALGVVLYQLLCGVLPFEENVYKDRNLLLKLLEEQPLIFPSRKVDEKEAFETAKLRRCSPKQLCSMLKGDLDSIVAKCMQAAPADRYHSVEALVDDITRYLDGRPVAAHPSSFSYYFLKYIKRDKRLTTAVFSFVIALIFLFSALVLRSKEKAQRERREAMVQMIYAMLKSANPKNDRKDIAGPWFVTVENQVSALIQDNNDKAELLIELGTSLASWGYYTEASEKFEQAIDVAIQDPSLEKLWQRARLEQAYALVLRDSPELAINELEDLLNWAEGEGRASMDPMRVKRGIADAMKTSNQVAEAVQAYENLFQLCNSDNLDCLAGKINYAKMLLDTDPLKSYHLSCEVLEARERLGASDADKLSAIHYIGWSLIKLNDFDGAKDYVKTAYKGRDSLFGNNLDTLSSLHNYVFVESRLKQIDPNEVISLYLDLYERKYKLIGYDVSTLRTMNNLAGAYNNINEYERALKIVREARYRINVQNIVNPISNVLDLTEVEILINANRYAEALELCQSLRKRPLPADERKAVDHCWLSLCEHLKLNCTNP